MSHYRFSGVDHTSMKIPEILTPFVDYANELDVNFKFNMCFINFYKDGNDYIGFHSDNESQIHRDKEGQIDVLSMSFGEERDFLLKPNDPKKGHKHEMVLKHGSVVLMAGLTQTSHKHSIKKVTNKTKANGMGRRVNLTFRRFK